MLNEMKKNAYYPVLYVWNSGEKVKKVVNSTAPYYSIAEALNHAYYTDYRGGEHIEPGYAYWNGDKWVSQTAEDYEESRYDDPDFRTRQDVCHHEANMRLENEARGWN